MLGGSGSTSVGLSIAALALVAAALVFSAVAKVVRPSRAGDGLVGLGFSKAIATKVGLGGIGLEWFLGVGLLISPGSWYVRGAVLALFCAFAGLGIAALRSGRRIECGCLGVAYSGTLGWPQVAQLAVAAPALLLPSTALGAWTIPAALAAVLVVHVAAAATFLGAAARPWRLVRAQRISLAGPRAFELAAGGEESAT
jgi:hypothetical protein